jgi:Na+-driven multidrug efflux pump
MLAMLLTHSLVARAFTTAADTSATTALGIVFRLETMALFVAMGWGSAAQTFVGQNLGAGAGARARASGWFAAGYNVALMAAVALALHAWATPIIRFFDADPRVVAIAASYVGVVSWSYVGLGTGVVLGSGITGAGATRTTLITDVAVIVGFQLPACVLAVTLPGATMTRLWVAVAATYAISGVAYALVFRFWPWARATERSG